MEEKSGTGSFNNGDVSQVSLYQVNSDGTETLLDTVSGSQLASDTADFDNFEVTVAAGTAETFRVYVDFVDDDTNAGLTYLAAITTYDVEDDDNNQVYDALDDSADGDFNADADQPTSARTITLVASGKLYVEMNNEDDTYETANKRWLQMGETDQGVLALSLRAENEDVTVNEWTIYLSAGDIGTTFSKFYVYNEDGVLLGSKSTSSSDDASITFNATATELTAYADETTTYYVTADLNEYGRDRVGALDGNGLAARTWTATVVEATGDSSNTSLDVDGDDDSSVEAGEVAYGSTTTGARAADGVDASTPEVTAASEAFGYLATELTTVELVSTATYNSQTATLASDLSTGTTRVAIVAITNNSTENIESDANGGVDLRTQLESLAFQINKNLDLTASTFTIDRVGGVDSPIAGTTVLTSDGSTAQAITNLITNTAEVEFLNLDSGWSTDDEIAPGETAYYVVECNITALGTGDSDDFIELSMEDLTDTNGAQNGADGDIHWYDATGAVVKTAVYMGSATDLDAIKVSEQN